ncbi:MAG: hypothetical protein OXI87_13135 [Albidovulum sp.]|nr:hypothetical protein [Albidovulum sp.]MDE0534402.1 hypothetical protein [Albidovulum sp.]
MGGYDVDELLGDAAPIASRSPVGLIELNDVDVGRNNVVVVIVGVLLRKVAAEPVSSGRRQIDLYQAWKRILSGRLSH